MKNCCSCKFCFLIFLVLLTFGVLALRLYYVSLFNIQFIRLLRYENERNAILQHEEYQRFGSFMTLNEAEEKANKYLITLKRFEYEKWHTNETLINIRGDFYKMRPVLRRSMVYSILKRMPKGAALHLHEYALANTKFLLNLTYRPDLWLCVAPLNEEYELMRFSLKQPNKTESEQHISCDWHFLAELRKSQGDRQVDVKLWNSLTFNCDWEPKPLEKLHKIQRLLKGLLTYAPIFREYFSQVFREFHFDNVQYLEIRSTLPKLYDMQGTPYTAAYTLETIRNESLRIASGSELLFGSRLIYAITRNNNDSDIDQGLAEYKSLKAQYPYYPIGIDLIDDNVNSSINLKAYSSKLMELQNEIDYYFSNDDTYWHESVAHENIIESYLLNTKRMIFHKALLAHPFLIARMSTFNIPIVINPLSDRFLKNMRDIGNHPAFLLFTYNLPLVISSDYPSFWRADPLTHDYYVVFMEIAGEKADLKVLKQLTFNSIYYSSLGPHKKSQALKIWSYQWNQWICYINQLFN